MALADILNKILSDAQEQSLLLQKEADGAIKQLQEQLDKEIAEESASSWEKGNRKIAELHQKIDHLSRQEYYHKTLSLKHEILQGVLKKAQEEVSHLSQKEKEAIFLQMLRQIGDQKGTLHPVASDAKLLEGLLEKEKIALPLGKSVSGIAGFIFVSESMEIDFRFEQALEDLFRKTEKELSSFLFA
ncbi:V-type ATP synthase subunit E [Candidatus Peregrinibacteria bacterium]|nr:MAG: V-type ATP synthase subunit E [Candidatus Peregrinibacteria bacterium]